MNKAQQDSASELKFTPIPIFSSNYVWLIQHEDEREVYITDPGDAGPVLEYLSEHGLNLKGILVTHSHNDHIGGIDQILSRYQSPVYGPKSPRIPNVDFILGESDSLELWPGIEAKILHLPGHLPEHIAFFIATSNKTYSLLCGDVIFSSGCGRMFSGPAHTFHQSLQRVAALPEGTEIYCAHEYTLDNIRFAKHVEPKNLDLDLKQREAERKLQQSACSLPTSVGMELRTNPFLRTDNDDIQSRLESLVGQRPETEVETFAALRRLKDSF